jgi:eukaryotic-like serine/threonine-protein kinase
MSPDDEDVADTLPVVATPPASGYAIGELLGRGGMGEVVLAHDRKIGREIALKRLRASEPTEEAIARFEREAKIQARLDHPAIVPVHDIGHDDTGRPYFTMKRLAGTTLAEHIAKRTATQQRMLRALVDVCLAIELAHQRGVVHRDLKPSNVMLGEYGEVYVLDWGVARVLDLRSESERERDPSFEIESLDAFGTQTGKLLGTPGYMAPEQVRSEPVGPAADVYALGSILYEVLTGERLHPRGPAGLTSTLERTDVSPAAHRPERAIAPELDAACVAALAFDASVRPTARELGERIQRYLDGDRDVERRCVLAATELAAARAAFATGDRALAVNRAGRAVALDPGATEATELLTKLIVEPPESMPIALARAFADEEARTTRERSRRAIAPYLSWFLITPLVPYLYVASWTNLIALYVAVAAMTLVAFVNWRVRAVPVWLLLGVQLVGAIVFSRLASPFILTPALITGMLMSSTSMPWINDRRWPILVWAGVATLAPFVLEHFGVFAPTWSLDVAGLHTHGTVFVTTTAIDATVIAAANVIIVLLLAGYMLGIARDRRMAQRRLYVQAWHLHQLLPRAAGERTIGA